MRLTKKQILESISKKLDQIDENEKAKRGKKYFPVTINLRVPNFELWFIFETFNGDTFEMRVPKMQRIPAGEEHT